MIGKLVLPLLGGGPSIWTTCMLFFQAALLAGYLYAHVVAPRLEMFHQVALHVGVLLLGAFTLPVAIPAWGMRPPTASAEMVPWLCLLLFAVVGLPFFALSANTPLLQSWLARDRSGREPYLLYAASNGGSLAGLASYPFLVEPSFSLGSQSRLWALGYCMLVILVSRAGLVAARNARPVGLSAELTSSHDLTGRKIALWVALAAVPSSLMLGFTTYISTEIAAAPLVWIFPLALYLVSFILVFVPRPVRPGPRTGYALCLLVASLLLGTVIQLPMPLAFALPLHLAMFFLAALVCHGRLAAEKPDPSELTGYFLAIAVGGALGGIINAVIAPLIFHDVLEYPLALVAACALRPSGERRSHLGADLLIPLGLGVLLVAVVLLDRRMSNLSAMVLLPASLLPCLFLQYRTRFALGLVAVVVAGQISISDDPTVLLATRNFFGIARVKLEGRFEELFNGAILHGREALAAEVRCVPSAYYHSEGPFGDVIAAFRSPENAHRVAAIGLGVGAIATYAQPGESWTFYEIDPAVAGIAEHEFGFLSSSCTPVRPGIVIGDGRLRLADVPDGQLGLVVVDAFSSGAIPIHLLTTEAMEEYFAKLVPGDLLALHLSTPYFDLRLEAAALAGELGLTAYGRDDPYGNSVTGKERSRWIVMARQPKSLERLAVDPRWHRLERPARLHGWTDDFSDLVSVLALQTIVDSSRSLLPWR
jgi:spermidine synthase